MNAAAFAAGYRAGHSGQPPAISADMAEHALEAIEAHPLRPLGPDDDEWAWHLIGWAVGQAIAQHRLGAP
jgi:hypothetical protein